MNAVPILTMILAFAAPLCAAQAMSPNSSRDLSARTLYYREKPDQDVLPPPSERKSASTETPKVEEIRPALPRAPKRRRGDEITTPQPAIPQVTNADPAGAVQNLGLRYTVLLVDRAGHAEPTDPNRVFSSGECVALSLEANRSGYLYVLSQGSTGRWGSLLPSPEMPSENNVIRSRQAIQVPAKYCFELDDQPGVERLFVMLSRSANRVYEMDQTIRHNPASRPAMLARLDETVQGFENTMASRDFKIAKITDPESASEPAQSVYVVNASNSPSDWIVTEIAIRHR